MARTPGIIQSIAALPKKLIAREKKRQAHILEKFAYKEVQAYEQILKRYHAQQLDPIKKKDLPFPESIFPGKMVPIEWWYFTGHLNSEKKRFGFEFCFFKFHPQAIRMGPFPLSIFQKEPYLMVHTAITDKGGKKFSFTQDSGIFKKNKISYSNVDLKLGNASLKMKNGFQARSSQIKLDFIPKKNIVRHFDKGYNVMYAPPEHRTYYLTYPRMETKGSIVLDGKKYEVNGVSWFDHQKCNSVKPETVNGWDWISVIFDDNTELMYFGIIHKKGISKKWSGGTFIHEDGTTTNISGEDVKIKITGKWKSPKTGITYPSGWKLNIAKINLDIEITPCVKEQEMDTVKTAQVSYWEGACDVKGTRNGKKIIGQSYVELLGYDKRLSSKIARISTF